MLDKTQTNHAKSYQRFLRYTETHALQEKDCNHKHFIYLRSDRYNLLDTQII